MSFVFFVKWPVPTNLSHIPILFRSHFASSSCYSKLGTAHFSSCPQGPAVAYIEPPSQQMRAPSTSSYQAWLEQRDGIPFCNVCNTPATAEHCQSIQHIQQLNRAFPPAPEIEQDQILSLRPDVAPQMVGMSSAADHYTNQPWCERRDHSGCPYWYCLACWKTITDTHLASPEHMRRVGNWLLDPANGAGQQAGMLLCQPVGHQLALPQPVDPELLQKPYIKMIDGFPQC